MINFSIYAQRVIGSEYLPVVPQKPLGTTGMAHNQLQGQDRMWAESLKKLRAGRLSPALQLTCPECGQEGLCMRFGKTNRLSAAARFHIRRCPWLSLRPDRYPYALKD